MRFFKFFNGGELEITGIFPAGVIKDSHANLLDSAELELYVHDRMYKVFAEVAVFISANRGFFAQPSH